MDYSRFLTVHFCDLCFFLSLFRICYIFKYTGGNIANSFLSFIILIGNLAPDIIHGSNTLNLILLDNLSRYFAILLTRIIQNITVSQRCKSTFCRFNLITVINLIRPDISIDLLNTLLSFMLISHLAPPIIAYRNTFHICSQIYLL